ncbi:MAG: ATP-binding protein, partial [Desulfobacterales bacterium]|nr:ATP-binding protein [Desulfobacterales bacterium]
MERDAMQILLQWKQKKNRKPLIISGARQVGKTWLMQEFGKREYEQTAYVNLEKSNSLTTLFRDDYNIDRIIAGLQIETGMQINADTTLIIFDEVQEAEGAITSLKYFYENAPQYQILAAGSYLGITLHSNTSFPVGKVDFLDMFPLSFQEFLHAMDQDALLNLIIGKDWEIIKSFKSKITQLLRTYYFVGGMPEVVRCYRDNNDFEEVQVNQKNILAAYENDFSKHAPSSIVPRIRMLWNSIPAQLAKENKKFLYKAVKAGSRAKEYELALSWLVDSGLAYKVYRVTKPGMPLKAYEDLSAFKLFMNDVGLLSAMGDMNARTLLGGNAIFEEFKGALTEQFVLQQLKTISGLVTYYWSAERSTAEIDFLIQYSGRVIPLEVKAEENLKAKSLKTFCEKYNP